MQATIKKTATHYYVLTMGEREMGGTNKQALVNYARKLGYRVEEVEEEYNPRDVSIMGGDPSL